MQLESATSSTELPGKRLTCQSTKFNRKMYKWVNKVCHFKNRGSEIGNEEK
jgi:hypothetical protein